jgi:peroxiredoxin
MQSSSINYKPLVLVIILVTGFSIFIFLKLDQSNVPLSDPESLGVGRPAPDFSFPGLDGKIVRLSDHRGKVVLVNVWATWCRPCVEEMPSMQKLYQKFKDDGFEILAVSIDDQGAGVVIPFMQHHKLTFPALIDSEGTIRARYGVAGVPESFIVDQQGFLVKKITGAADWSAPGVFRFIEKLL